MKALFLNCSLKDSNETSNTDALYKEAETIFHEEGVESETVRVADYNIAYGISEDEGKGDEWPIIFDKVKAADIVVLGTPLWLGEKSSVATLVIERLYGGSGITNEKGQSIYYNKVGGVVITGNEDGAKNAARSVLYAFSHIGFTVPPNVDTYWVGEAGPGESYIKAEGQKNDFSVGHAKTMAHNLIHFAQMFRNNPIPAKGNTME
ncbi:flavodoxin family protein [Guptibacillus algicola]|uniref:flavodoxin family protein n=1 Tax=Guptibacillus algicola TaxID=225844 RepID=UPI001CD1BCF8|nr:flavodoxin family protein [Alkalihalobacillus algicola]MCA0986742.1 flavodoxin family protein [Alkalihalobacillus algicola]